MSVSVAQAATLSGRVTHSIALPPTARSSNSKDFIHQRIMQIQFTLSAAERAGNPFVEIVYYRMDDPAHPELRRLKGAINGGEKSASFSVIMAGPEKMKINWAARLVVNGTAVAWAGETSQAITLINPPPFTL